MPPEALVSLASLARPWSAGRLADLPPPRHDPSEAREAADRILSRPEYRWEDDRGLLDRIGDWVADQVGRITGPLGLGGAGLPAWVGWLVLVALVSVVALLIYRRRGGWRRDRLRHAAGGGRVVVSAGEEAVDWAAEVERCEAEGRWREALRARYRVLVGELAARRVIGDLVGRTAGELLAEVRAAAPGAAADFGAATALFEAAWYGGVEVGPADRDRFVRLADGARTATRGVAPRLSPATPAAPAGPAGP